VRNRREQMLAFHKAKMESMMEGVRTLHSTEEVPARYAVETLRVTSDL
jgi:hypothetical protein